jgi:3-oxoadipate enol-lactonase
MSFVEAGDLRVHYVLSGPPDCPLVVLSNSVGSDLTMWDAQLPALEASFRVLRYDTRGHGRTSVTPGPGTIEQLGRDVPRLLDALRLERGHFCGLSMGGLIGMWLAAREPTRVGRLVLCNTAPRIGTTESWNARIDTVRRLGMKAVAPAIVERWFTPEFRARSPETVAWALGVLEGTPAEGYAAACAALRDADERADLPAIGVPTLVVAGTRDVATPAAEGRSLADGIAGAQYVELDAAHLSNLEAPARFTSELMRFLAA